MVQPTVEGLLLCYLSAGPGSTHLVRSDQWSSDRCSSDRWSSADWEEAIQLSIKHGITPLFYQRLRADNGRLAVPPHIELRLRELYHKGALESIARQRELGRVLQLLRGENIPVIVLKGAHLGGVVYEHVTLRSMCDLDILVRKADLAKASEALLSAGYESSHQSRIDVEVATHQHLPHFAKPDRAPIEIHWTIANPSAPFTIDVDELWKRSIPATIANTEVLVLSFEDLIMHLCLHTSYQHKFVSGLRTLCDISEILRHSQGKIEWDQVQSRAHQWQASKYVHLVLYLARELLGAPVPERILINLQPGRLDPKLIALVREKIFGHLSLRSPDFTRFWGAKSLRDKLILLSRSVFPSLDVMAKMYPAPPDSLRIYCYYPVRLKHILDRHGRIAWYLLWRNEEMVALAKRENELIEWLAPFQ